MIKRVSIVGIVGIPASYGGFESLVENLTENTSDAIRYEVFCSSKHYPKEKRTTEHNRAKLTYIPLSANGIQSVPYDIYSLIKCLISKPDSVLILGVSGCIFLPIFKLFSKAKVITNIDGLEWKRDKWGLIARKFLKLSESIAVKYSDVVVTDNQVITNYVFSEYGSKSETIAYGGDHAIRGSIDCTEVISDYSLALCRIEPENNVEMILRAFTKTSNKLKFVGNWDSSEFGRSLKEKYKNIENIEIIDPIYNLDRLFELRRKCTNYIHGHSAGGTNPSLVEMMHFRKIIFAFDCDFNRYSTENRAYYFSSSEALAENMIQLRGSSSIGEDMYDIACRKYVWKDIVKAYELTY